VNTISRIKENRDWLPVRNTRDDVATYAPSVREQAETITILIADDDYFARRTLSQLIQGVPDFVLMGEAKDGQRAIADVLSLRPRVVIVKIGLPLVNGLEVTKQIKHRLPASAVLCLSSDNSDQAVYQAFSAGANGFCLDSTPSKHLLVAIRAVACGAAWLDPQAARRRQTTGAPAFPVAAPEPADRSAPEMPLSVREVEVLRLLAEGLSNREIAHRLTVSPETVKTHVKHIMEKLAVGDRTQAVVAALRNGLFQ